jgi:hypothetical protein
MTMSIEAVTAQSLLDHVSMPTGDMSSLSLKFDQMMSHDPGALDHNKPLNNDRSTVATDFVAKGEAVMRNTFESMNKLMVDAPFLNNEELAVRQMQLSMQVALSFLQFNGCSQVAQSGKNSMQTLMKNQ